MKKLKNVATSVALALVMLVSFSVNAQKLSQKEQEQVKAELRNGMASFVEGVKAYYKNGTSYEDFRKSLVGKGETKMTEEGNAMLKKAFNYLSKGTSQQEIAAKDSMIEIAAAAVFISQYNDEHKSSIGDSILFGNPTLDTLSTNNLAVFNSAYKCRWWQLKCHLQSIFGESGGNTLTNALVQFLIGFLS